MKKVLFLMARIAFKCGIEGAGLPSYHMIHEAEVPAELIEMYSCNGMDDKEWRSEN